ncbi:hypothetical protein SDC9_129812 [bioreactor metagenome]|uniref:Uncharacterized protein n=1 Tax=bioreactor metagenome TaxID=1076179 RepID=A0A645CZU9_9ZZZZ
MYYIWIFLLTVRICIYHAKSAGQLKIDLNRDKSIFLAVYILDLDIKLGSVESGLSRGFLVIDFKIIEYDSHTVLHAFPFLGRADIFRLIVFIPFREAV